MSARFLYTEGNSLIKTTETFLSYHASASSRITNIATNLSMSHTHASAHAHSKKKTKRR